MGTWKWLALRAGNIHLGGERHYESKVSCPRTQRSASASARTRTARSGVQRTNQLGHCASHHALSVHKRPEKKALANIRPSWPHAWSMYNPYVWENGRKGIKVQYRTLGCSPSPFRERILRVDHMGRLRPKVVTLEVYTRIAIPRVKEWKREGKLTLRCERACQNTCIRRT